MNGRTSTDFENETAHDQGEVCLYSLHRRACTVATDDRLLMAFSEKIS